MKKLPILLLLLALALAAQAQLNVQVVMPPMSPRVADIYARSNQFLLIVTNTTANDIAFRAQGQVTRDGALFGTLAYADSPVESIEAFGTRNYRLSDLYDLEQDLQYDRAYAQQIVRSGFVPAGVYEWCFELLDANNPNLSLSALQCRSVVLTTYQPPTALQPAPDQVFAAGQRPLFRWSPVVPAFPGVLSYELQVFEVLPGQDAVQAFRSNQAIWERATPALQQPWPFEVPMEPGQYVWAVQAFDAEGNRIGETETYSEFRSFSLLAAEPLAAGGTARRIDFVSKGQNSGPATYSMVLPADDVPYLEKCFALSDQADKYDMVQTEVPASPGDDNVVLPIYNAWGDVVRLVTADGPLLSFGKNAENDASIGWGSDIRAMAKGNGKGTRNMATANTTKPGLL